IRRPRISRSGAPLLKSGDAWVTARNSSSSGCAALEYLYSTAPPHHFNCGPLLRHPSPTLMLLSVRSHHRNGLEGTAIAKLLPLLLSLTFARGITLLAETFVACRPRTSSFKVNCERSKS